MLGNVKMRKVMHRCIAVVSTPAFLPSSFQVPPLPVLPPPTPSLSMPIYKTQLLHPLQWCPAATLLQRWRRRMQLRPPGCQCCIQQPIHHRWRWWVTGTLRCECWSMFIVTWGPASSFVSILMHSDGMGQVDLDGMVNGWWLVVPANQGWQRWGHALTTVSSMVVGEGSCRRSHDLVDLWLCTSLSLILSSSTLKMACDWLDGLGGCFRIFW